MSTIIDTGRDIMAVMSPVTGTRATGVVTITASGADVELPAATYLVPRLGGQYRPDLVVKSKPSDDYQAGWTITAGGVDVDCVANIGGVPHNTLIAGTELLIDPPLDGIDTCVVKTGFSGGAAPTGLAAVKSMVLYEQFRASAASLDMVRSGIKEFPGILISWMGSEPADGAAVDQTTQRRVSGTATMYHETFQVLVVSNRAESDHMRRLQGLYILDAITGLLTSRVDFDGGLISYPSGLQVQQRFRREIPDTKGSLPYYIYGLQVSAMRVYHMTDARTFETLAEVVYDIVKPQDPALPNQGDIAIVGDGSLGLPGMEVECD